MKAKLPVHKRKRNYLANACPMEEYPPKGRRIGRSATIGPQGKPKSPYFRLVVGPRAHLACARPLLAVEYYLHTSRNPVQVSLPWEEWHEHIWKYAPPMTSITILQSTDVEVQ